MKLPEDEVPGAAVAPGGGVAGRDPGDGAVGRGAVRGVGAVMDREPRLPEERPPPARAQASSWKAQANRNNRAKRVKIPFVQVFNCMDFLRENFGLESIGSTHA
jgi:hypothetical protein